LKISFRASCLLLALTAQRSLAQHIERDLAYGTDPAQKFDIAVPASKGYSTVIFIHGGSLNSGDKTDSDYGPVCDPFPSVNVACINMNYRLAPRHRWPAPAQDVAAMFAWTRAHIAERGGDPSKIFLFGHSSGATLAAIIGSDERFLAAYQLKPSDVRGVIPMGSIMWDDDFMKAIARLGKARVEERIANDADYAQFGGVDGYIDHWPISHIHAGMPPFLFLIGEEEQVNPPLVLTDSTFAHRAREAGNWAKYQVFSGRGHYSMIRRLHLSGVTVFATIKDFIRDFSR
jgi:acetyl esterase/lipase